MTYFRALSGRAHGQSYAYLMTMCWDTWQQGQKRERHGEEITSWTNIFMAWDLEWMPEWEDTSTHVVERIFIMGWDWKDLGIQSGFQEKYPKGWCSWYRPLPHTYFGWVHSGPWDAADQPAYQQQFSIPSEAGTAGHGASCVWQFGRLRQDCICSCYPRGHCFCGTPAAYAW